jgi:pimeloyl-ACP methyl ester carboxylesterase
MYRANVSQRLRAPQRRHIPVPVQLVVPRDDAYVTPVLAHAAVPWVSRLYRRDVDGSHWSVRNEPDAFVGAITSFVDSVQSGDLFPIAHFAWPPSRRKTS